MTQTNELVVFGTGRDAVELMIDSRGLGAQVQGKITFDRWKILLTSWRSCRKGWELVLADILAYGLEQFGREKVDVALNQLEFDLGDALKALAIGQLSLDLRTETLGSDHYFVLSKANLTAKEQGRWVAIATKEGLKAVELQKSIEAGKVLRQADINRESGRDSGIPTIQGLAFWFDRWERKVGGEDAILAWDRRLKEQWLAEVRPILSLAAKLEETL
ncbi:MAG: hypothetical protein ACOYMV_01275 [Verrucomicrobiia bacterium]